MRCYRESLLEPGLTPRLVKDVLPHLGEGPLCADFLHEVRHYRDRIAARIKALKAQQAALDGFLRHARPPHSRSGEYLIRVDAAGVNFADVMQTRGTHGGGPQPPYVAGFARLRKTRLRVDRQVVTCITFRVWVTCSRLWRIPRVARFLTSWPSGTGRRSSRSVGA